jgi:hypothetical protein
MMRDLWRDIPITHQALNAVPAGAAFEFKGDVVTLRTELIEYVELLDDLLCNDEVIDGEAVPRELRDILNRTSQDQSEGEL